MQTVLILTSTSLSCNLVVVIFRGEEFPENILQAAANLKTVNIIPAFGKLRVFRLIDVLKCSQTNIHFIFMWNRVTHTRFKRHFRLKGDEVVLVLHRPSV